MSRPLLLFALLTPLLLPLNGRAEELIHFDCMSTGRASGEIPRHDLANDPPNDRQCLAIGASVLGKGTVHPHLEIKSPIGHNVVKIRASDPTYTVFVSQDGATRYNNCLEFLDQGRRLVSEEFSGAWGFGDATACHGDMCEGPKASKAELDFIFHDMTVEQFSIRMVDWGDYRPQAGDPDDFQTTLTAYDATGAVVDTFNFHFSVDGRDREDGRIVYKCASEVENNCFDGGDDLAHAGDACNANAEEPGYLTLGVDGKGIARLELRVPSHGFDPNVGFDSIRFTPE